MIDPTPAVVVVQTCKAHHETAYAVDGVSFDDAMMGEKTLDSASAKCLWPRCEETEFISAALYNSEVRHYD